MTNWRQRFFDGAFIGFIVIILLLGWSVWVFVKGADNGRYAQQQEIERSGGGRYIVITLDGRDYRGWLHS